MIEITAEYFAAFREQAGRAAEPIATASATAAELFDEVAGRHGFLDARSRCKVAINGEMASWRSALNDGDTVLFFPPVAGG
jgi:molybdopterin converting factor subunit 1